MLVRRRERGLLASRRRGLALPQEWGPSQLLPSFPHQETAPREFQPLAKISSEKSQLR